jgi:hypothetical protein
MRTAQIKILETSYPLPGTTKFEAGITRELAEQIACAHYDNIQAIELITQHTRQEWCPNSNRFFEKVDKDNPTHPYYAIRLTDGYAANVGIHQGKPAIVHRLPDGGRELQILKLN